jgi:hypothetical protein
MEQASYSTDAGMQAEADLRCATRAHDLIDMSN